RNDLKLATLGTLGGRLRDLQTAAGALQADGLFTARNATLNTPGAGWSLQAAPGTAAGSYAFSVAQLATAARQVGAADIGRGWQESDDVSGLTLATLPSVPAITAGRFTVNGQQIEIALTDSLQDVF